MPKVANQPVKVPVIFWPHRDPPPLFKVVDQDRFVHVTGIAQPGASLTCHTYSLLLQNEQLGMCIYRCTKAGLLTYIIQYLTTEKNPGFPVDENCWVNHALK